MLFCFLVYLVDVKVDLTNLSVVILLELIMIFKHILNLQIINGVVQFIIFQKVIL